MESEFSEGIESVRQLGTARERFTILERDSTSQYLEL